MATINLKFRPSAKEGKEGRLIIQVIHRRRTRQQSTPYTILPSEWDEKRSAPAVDQATGARKSYLEMAAEVTAEAQKRLSAIAQQWEEQGRTFTADELISAYDQLKPQQTVFTFTQQVIIGKANRGQYHSARNFTTALHRLQEFRNGTDLTFPALSSDLLEQFEEWLLNEKSLRRNTTSCYLRCLRTVYLEAVQKGYDTRRPLFAHVYMGIDTTMKRALTKRDLQTIRMLEFPSLPHLSLARDLFLLSFYLRGMPFVDMAYLKKTDLHKGYIHYCRRKTRRPIEVRWENEMQEIVDRYSHLTQKSPFLLPIILKADGTEHKQYEQAMLRQNRNLKTVGHMAGIATPLTQYAARHSWASIAYNANVPMAIISRGMGHSNEHITLTYIKSLDTSAVDRANYRLIKL